jgi:hypothetical protein
MAKELAVPYSQLYLVCYAIPNFSIHATLASAARWEGQGDSESEADFLVLNASWVFALVLDSQDQLFDLNLHAEINAICRELQEYPNKLT